MYVIVFVKKIFCRYVSNLMDNYVYRVCEYINFILYMMKINFY